MIIRFLVGILYLCFFFKAEDGIRALVRSGGLGDVYKRQVLQVALADLEPKPLGRPPEIVSEDAQQQAARVVELERELAAQTVRLELAQVLPHVVQSPAAAALKKTNRHQLLKQKRRERRARPK